MRLARRDRSEADRTEALLSRICTPVTKYWACKRAPQFVVEALECHGGNGFVADHLMERLYREAPLNGIWEGTGNVICLDVLRSMQREPETVDVFLGEVAKARGANTKLDAFADDLKRRLTNPAVLEPNARRVVELMAFALQASLLVRYSSSAVADAFCTTRLDGDWGRAFGTMPQGLDTQAIVDRARIEPETFASAVLLLDADNKRNRATFLSGLSMSALGHKRTYAVQNAMSALPPIATLITFLGTSALSQKQTPSEQLRRPTPRLWYGRRCYWCGQSANP